MLVVLWIVGGLIALIVIAMFMLPMFIDEQALLDMAQEQVKANTGGDLVVEGGAELSFFPVLGSGWRTRFSIYPHRRITTKPFELDHRTGCWAVLLPLLGGKVDVGTIVIAGVAADITEPQALPPPRTCTRHE
ncbi:MAG: hypothetical protein CM15mP74_26700 [Halieaceae bacterium]|nr:MAG: hypothetical protein CM15mP74_26700 [Halieaceae bacterium]